MSATSQTLFLVVALVAVSASLQADESAIKLLEQAQRAASQNDSTAAVRLATSALARDSRLAEAFYLRGREHFRLGMITEAVADFDGYVALRPDLESRQWERGIALYYARQYERGAKQFELYQTFHDNDVENSVWRFLCMTPDVGVEKARSVMLPIRDDRRVPMMQIYELYRGNLKPEEVLKATQADAPPAEVLAGRLFYAHLYLGLYYEVTGALPLAKKYIHLAADKSLADNSQVNRYMWDVARIHAQSFNKDTAGAEASGKAK